MPSRMADARAKARSGSDVRIPPLAVAERADFPPADVDERRCREPQATAHVPRLLLPIAFASPAAGNGAAITTGRCPTLLPHCKSLSNPRARGEAQRLQLRWNEC